MATTRAWDPKSPNTASGGGPTPAPVVLSLNPNTAVVGGPDLTVSVRGTGFGADAVIVWNGGDEPTTRVSDTEVTTIVKPSTASGPWAIPVAVRSGGKVSNSVTFQFSEMAAQAPVVTALTPSTAVVGGPDTTLVVTGTGFTPSSVIVFNGGDEPTTYLSATQVSTGLRPSTASGPFTVPVQVRDEGGLSNPVNFTFTYPTVTAPGQEGWTVRNQVGGGAMSFVTGPAGNPVGTGSLRLSTGNSSADEVALQHTAGFPDIATITDLSYVTNAVVPGNNNAGNIVLVLDCTATGNGEGYLIYIPSKNGTVVTNTWQTWNTTAAGTDNWWMPTPCTGDGTEPNSTRSWSAWRTALAGVQVKGYSISLGSGEANSDTHVTSFTINGKTVDFEAPAGR